MDTECRFPSFINCLSLLGFIFLPYLNILFTLYKQVNCTLFYFLAGESSFYFCDRFGGLHCLYPILFHLEKRSDVVANRR